MDKNGKKKNILWIALLAAAIVAVLAFGVLADSIPPETDPTEDAATDEGTTRQGWLERIAGRFADGFARRFGKVQGWLDGESVQWLGRPMTDEEKAALETLSRARLVAMADALDIPTEGKDLETLVDDIAAAVEANPEAARDALKDLMPMRGRQPGNMEGMLGSLPQERMEAIAAALGISTEGKDPETLADDIAAAIQADPEAARDALKDLMPMRGDRPMGRPFAGRGGFARGGRGCWGGQAPAEPTVPETGETGVFS